MKIIPIIISLALIFPIVSPAAAASAKSKFASDDYSIEYELFSETKQAKVFNNYKKQIANYFNYEVKSARKASKNYTYPLFTEDDIDFTDDDKISCLKTNISYTDYQFDEDIKSFAKKLKSDDECYSMTIQKGRTVYHGFIRNSVYIPADNGKKQIKIDGFCIGGWSIKLSIIGDADKIANRQYGMQVVNENLQEKLAEAGEDTDSEISVIGTDLGYFNTIAYVVFVDGTAKYIYYYSMRLPYDELKKKTPQVVSDVLRSYEDENYYNYQGDMEIRRLHSFNTVISMFMLCEYYS